MGKDANLVDQEFKIKRLLAIMTPRCTVAEMARRLALPYGSVLANVLGHRRNREVQAQIAAYLRAPVAELFGDNGHD